MIRPSRLSLVALISTSCVVGEEPNQTPTEAVDHGRVSFRLIDAPANVAALEITARELRFRPCGGGGWEVFDIEDKTVDLLELVDGVFASLLEQGAMPIGEWCEGRILLDPLAHLTLADNSVHELVIPSSSSSGLEIKGRFEVVPGAVVTNVAIDFDVEESLHEQGNGTYKMRPVIRIADVSYQPSDGGPPIEGEYQDWTTFTVWPNQDDVFGLPGGATISFEAGAVDDPTQITVTRWTNVPGAVGDLYVFSDHPTFGVAPVLSVPVVGASPNTRIWLDATEVLPTTVNNGFAVASVPHFSPVVPRDSCVDKVASYWCVGESARVLCDGQGNIVGEPAECTCTQMQGSNDRCSFNWDEAPWAEGQCLSVTGEYDQGTHTGIYALDIQDPNNCLTTHDLTCGYERCRVQTDCRPNVSAYGSDVCIEELDDQNQPTGKWLFAAHLSAINVQDGVLVNGGDNIGHMGNSGLDVDPNATCQRYHFHLETATSQSGSGMLDDDDTEAFPFTPANQFTGIIEGDRVCSVAAVQAPPQDPPPEDGCPNPGFADLTQAHWSYDYVRKLVCANVIDGPTPEKPNFLPDIGTNRAEYLRIHLELAFPNEDFENLNYPLDFVDVSADAWYAPYVAFAAAKGIVEGYEGNLFKPGDTVNRAEAAEIAVNIGNALDVEASARYELLSTEYSALLGQGQVPNEFDDVDWVDLKCAEDAPAYETTCWFYHPVYTLRDFDGAVCGKGNNLFDPAADVLRSETVKIACIVSGVCVPESCN